MLYLVKLWHNLLAAKFSSLAIFHNSLAHNRIVGGGILHYEREFWLGVSKQVCIALQYYCTYLGLQDTSAAHSSLDP